MNKEKHFKDKVQDFVNSVKDDSKFFNKKDIESGKGMVILAYILPFIPYLVEKKNKFVKYHSAQGMNLLIIVIAYSIIYSILTSIIKVNGSCGTWFGYNIGNYCKVTPWWVTLPLSLIGLGFTILCVIGIINVCNGKAKELPVVNKIKIF